MNREQCNGCAYFMTGGGGDSTHTAFKFCHYMLYTAQRRKVGENEKCLSRAETRKKVTPAFVVPTQQA